MNSQDKDRKCLELALKHIETLEERILEIENNLAKSSAMHFKKNTIISAMLHTPGVYSKLELENKNQIIDWHSFIGNSLKVIDEIKNRK